MGHYVACFSPDGPWVEPNANYGMGGNNPPTNPSVKHALFNVNTNRRYRDCTDGLSNTVAVSEIIAGTSAGSAADIRGLWWYPWGACYTHLNGPNSPVADRIGGGPTYCVSTLVSPCVVNASDSQITVDARSNHPGGVQAVWADGSVHFVSNEVSLSVWQALASMNGGEVLGASPYPGS